MARRPPEDSRKDAARGSAQDSGVTDLGRYRKAREKARRRPTPKPPGQSFLGSNPRAGLILALLALVLTALYLAPRFL